MKIPVPLPWMTIIELRSGPVYVERAELLEALRGASAENVVLVTAGMSPEAVSRELLASGADLVCASQPFTEAVKRVGDEVVGLERSGLSVPILPAAARRVVLLRALDLSSGEEFSPAEGVSRAGGTVLLLD